MTPPRIFDPVGRGLRRDRYIRQGSDELEHHVATMIGERLDPAEAIGRALIVNSGKGALAARLQQRGIGIDTTDHGPHAAALAGGRRVDEDRLSFESADYDAVFVPAGLATLDDVPGALIAARRALRPGGLMIAVLPGAPMLPRLRTLLAHIDPPDRAVARIHPMIDVRTGGDLMVRAGFVASVADVETRAIGYRSLDRLIDDIRAAGLGNMLAHRFPMTRTMHARLRAGFAALADDDGRVVEHMSLITLTGRAPPPR